ncbi:putative annexin [Helianthus debilis subsp. tardiflorus]
MGIHPFLLNPLKIGTSCGYINIWDNRSSAWPVANAVLTCASGTASGISSNFVLDPFLYAKVLYKSMQGLGTNDTTLIRVIVTRTEIDMQYIKAKYNKKYNKNLNDAVHSETSGHYRTFLLSLLGPNH